METAGASVPDIVLPAAFPYGGHCSPLSQFLETEMKPANGPWSLEAIEATSLPSLYRAQAPVVPLKQVAVTKGNIERPEPGGRVASL